MRSEKLNDLEIKCLTKSVGRRDFSASRALTNAIRKCFGQRFSLMLMSLLLTITTTGCLSLRHHSALESSWLPESSVALLPVISDDIELRYLPTNKLVRITNKVLDCLAVGETNKLMGPIEVTNRLGDVSSMEQFARDIGHTVVPVYEATSNMLANCARALGVNQVVLTQISLRKDDPQTVSFGEIAMLGSWSGTVQVDMELVELSPLHFVRRASAYSNYDGMAGIVLVLIPVYGQRTVGRAVDDACRNALHRLFENENQSIFPPSLGSTNAQVLSVHTGRQDSASN